MLLANSGPCPVCLFRTFDGTAFRRPGCSWNRRVGAGNNMVAPNSHCFLMMAVCVSGCARSNRLPAATNLQGKGLSIQSCLVLVCTDPARLQSTVFTACGNHTRPASGTRWTAQETVRAGAPGHTCVFVIERVCWLMVISLLSRSPTLLGIAYWPYLGNLWTPLPLPLLLKKKTWGGRLSFQGVKQ